MKKALFFGLDAKKVAEIEANLRKEGYDEFESVDDIKCARRKLQAKGSNITQVGMPGFCGTPARALEIFEAMSH